MFIHHTVKHQRGDKKGYLKNIKCQYFKISLIEKDEQIADKMDHKHKNVLGHIH